MLKIGPFGDYIRGIAHPGIAFYLQGFIEVLGLCFYGIPHAK